MPIAHFADFFRDIPYRMNKLGIDPSLLYLEVPLYENDLLETKCQEILINEGKPIVSVKLFCFL